jgi:hypothetical protein
MVISYSPTSLWASTDNVNHIEKNYFQFVIPEYHTSRQSGQTVTIYVRYAYKKKLPNSEYPDYRVLRTAVLKYMEPTVEFPAEVFWEILATAMGRDLKTTHWMVSVFNWMFWIIQIQTALSQVIMDLHLL